MLPDGVATWLPDYLIYTKSVRYLPDLILSYVWYPHRYKDRPPTFFFFLSPIFSLFPFSPFPLLSRRSLLPLFNPSHSFSQQLSLSQWFAFFASFLSLLPPFLLSLVMLFGDDIRRPLLVGKQIFFRFIHYLSWLDYVSQPTMQNYDVYHDRYLKWDCQNQHNTTFFDKCCHPLLVDFLLPFLLPAHIPPEW